MGFYTEIDLSDPRWHEATKVHDWRNYIPERMRKMWGTFSAEQRHAIMEMAAGLADQEIWE